jgi:uncharacterized membrane protein YeaQ/YmgE (transglycosylase-associated protein family)
MNKRTIMLGMVFGSAIGGYLPTLFGSDSLSFASVICTFIGGAIGIWLTFKILN